VKDCWHFATIISFLPLDYTATENSRSTALVHHYQHFTVITFNMALLLPLIISCALGLTIAITLSFVINLQKARSTGLSYAISPITELENIAYLTDFLLRWKYKDYLSRGEGWPHWARFMVKDWMYEDRGRAHREFGEVFLVVSPGGIVCYVGNAKTAASVCTNKNFIKPREKMSKFCPITTIISDNGLSAHAMNSRNA